MPVAMPCPASRGFRIQARISSANPRERISPGVLHSLCSTAWISSRPFSCSSAQSMIGSVSPDSALPSRHVAMLTWRRSDAVRTTIIASSSAPITVGRSLMSFQRKLSIVVKPS